MSTFFFCVACGHNLTYISDRRLKCYGCGKYYTENFICRCARDRAFKFSAEIIAPNKVKCHFCGKVAQVAANLEPPHIDKYRGVAGAGGSGSWDGQIGSFQPQVRKLKSVRPSKQKVSEPEIEKPGVDYISENQDEIIIRFPGHVLDQIRCEIVNGFLEVQSLLVDFSEKFPLPDFPIELITELRNGVFDIRLQRKAKK